MLIGKNQNEMRKDLVMNAKRRCLYELKIFKVCHGENV